MKCRQSSSYRSWSKTASKPLRAEGRHSAREKTYLIRFKSSHMVPHLVTAASAEIHGDHLVFLRSDGSLTALFALEIVESWPEVEP